MWRILSACVVLFLAAGVAQDRAQRPSQNYLSVSMLQLLTTPEQFNGKPISVIGFLTMNHEGDLLFAHQEDAVNVILGNAIQIEGTNQMWQDVEKLDMKYVKILGTFQASDRHRIPFYSGAIVRIERCDFWSDPAHPMGLRLSGGLIR